MSYVRGFWNQVAKKYLKHKYLLSLYTRVNDYLSSETNDGDELPDIIVSFCVVIEKIFKIKLYKKNPFLAFDASVMREETIPIIALRKEVSIDTAKIKNVIDRFEIVFKNVFSPDELQALKDIYEVRNHFMHGYKTDDKIPFDSEDIIKKMGTLWEKISKIAVEIFGKSIIKSQRPKKKYTEEELEKVLEDEVREMIKVGSNYVGLSAPLSIKSSFNLSLSDGEECPRCGDKTFSLGDSNPLVISATSPFNYSAGGIYAGNSRLYKCSVCNLELTKKQYDAAKKILGK